MPLLHFPFRSASGDLVFPESRQHLADFGHAVEALLRGETYVAERRFQRLHEAGMVEASLNLALLMRQRISGLVDDPPDVEIGIIQRILDSLVGPLSTAACALSADAIGMLLTEPFVDWRDGSESQAVCQRLAVLALRLAEMSGPSLSNEIVQHASFRFFAGDLNRPPLTRRDVTPWCDQLERLALSLPLDVFPSLVNLYSHLARLRKDGADDATGFMSNVLKDIDVGYLPAC